MNPGNIPNGRGGLRPPPFPAESAAAPAAASALRPLGEDVAVR
jgi:hypothetical protein